MALTSEGAITDVCVTVLTKLVACVRFTVEIACSVVFCDVAVLCNDEIVLTALLELAAAVCAAVDFACASTPKSPRTITPPDARVVVSTFCVLLSGFV